MAASAPPFQPGQVLPGTKYTVVQQLGVGGMGVVYQVKKPPEIHCVLKLLSADLTGDVEFQTRFFDEVRVLAQLEHPNVVRVFDYDMLSDGTPFYVMELLHGRTVRDVLASMGTVPPRVAFEITRQLLEALHGAHTNDVAVVHRDIKPENIFLHAPRHGEPTVKLIDFGVVAFPDHTHDDTFVGTPSYAAPEQVRGERATPATDLYAVGLVLYEMLAGRGPFDHHPTATLISLAHLREAPAPVTDFAPWVPPSVVALIASALSKDPRERPRDAYAFIERLYDLQWADDGTHPPATTAEGPLKSMLGPALAPRVADPKPRRTAGQAQAKIHRDTLRGLDGNAFTAPPPREDTLLEGLDRRSDPGISRPRREARSAPRARPATTDTLGSQTSDTSIQRRRKKGIFTLVIVAVAMASALVVVAFVKPTTDRGKVLSAEHETSSASIAPPMAPPATTTAPISSAALVAPEVVPDAGRAVDKPSGATKKPPPATQASVNTSFAREP